MEHNIVQHLHIPTKNSAKWCYVIIVQSLIYSVHWYIGNNSATVKSGTMDSANSKSAIYWNIKTVQH